MERSTCFLILEKLQERLQIHGIPEILIVTYRDVKEGCEALLAYIKQHDL